MIDNPHEIWKKILAELERIRPRGEFDIYLLGTVCIGVEDNTLIIAVKNQQAVECLRDRLKKPIGRLLRRFAEGGDVGVRYVVSEVWPPHVGGSSTSNESDAGVISEAEGEPATAPDPATTLRMTREGGREKGEGGHGGHAEQVQGCHSERCEESPESDVLESLYVALNRIGNPTARMAIQQEIAALEGNGNAHDVEEWESPGELDKSKGFSMVSHLESQFWSVYLDPNSFLCWLAIYRRDKRSKKTPWTPYFRLSAPELANEVGCSTQLIHDLWRRCDADDPGAVLHAPHDTFGPVERARKPGYYQYRPGLIERLRLAGIARYEIEGTRSRKLYVVSVKTNLGWLSPQQLSTLKPEVQRAHDRFVMQQGLDPALWH